MFSGQIAHGHRAYRATGRNLWVHLFARLTSRRCHARALVGHRAEGQALVELAFVLVFLCSLLIVVIDFSRIMNLHLVTIHAAREGARIASLSTAPTTAIAPAAQNAAGDAIPSTALSVTCNQATLTGSTGAYSVGGACATNRAASSAFVVTASTVVEPVLPFSGLLFGSFQLGPVTVSHAAVGVVHTEP